MNHFLKICVFFVAASPSLGQWLTQDSMLCSKNDFLSSPCLCEQQQVDCGSRNIQVKKSI